MPLVTPSVGTLQSAATASGNGTPMNVSGYLSAVVHVVSSVAMSGGTTVNFEASVDGVTYVSVFGQKVGTTSLATSTTTDGDYRVNVAEFAFFRARISAYSAGTTTISLWAITEPVGFLVLSAGLPAALGQTTMSASSPVAIASDQTKIPVQLVDGTSAAIDLSSPATGTLANVAGSASSVTVLAANANRKGAVVVNDSTAILYVKFGSTASTTSFTYYLAGNIQATLEVPFGYTGIITGIWASATGSARVTELT